MGTVKMALIGAGTWGQAHASIYHEHRDADLVAVCDQDRAKAEALAAQYGVAEVYTDTNDLLRHCTFDAAAIVTPDFLHAEIAVACANAGRHMLIEKPLATSERDVHHILEAVEKNGVRAMVDLHNRWNPPFNVVRQLLDSGNYGKAMSAYCRLNDQLWVATDMLRWSADSSILWFLGTHSLDTLNWLIDDLPKTVYAVKHEGKLKGLGLAAVDSYMATLQYRGGAIAQMENAWVTPNGNGNINDFKFNLLCEDGKFDIDASSHNLLQVTNSEKTVVQDILVRNTVFGRCQGFAYESIRSFVDKLADDSPFHVSLRSSANVSMAILAILESAKNGRPTDVKLL